MKPKWNGLCPAGKHGLDYQSQPCDLCPAFCPHCGRPRSPHNVTCLRSSCQEADYTANRERNAAARRGGRRAH